MNPYYECRHIAEFGEPNVGHVRWRDHSCPLFMSEHARHAFGEPSHDLELTTTNSECERLAEIRAFDELSIRTRVSGLTETPTGPISDEFVAEEDSVRARGPQPSRFVPYSRVLQSTIRIRRETT